MGKFSVGRSIISKAISATKIARTVSSAMSIQIPDMSSLASQATGGKISGIDEASIMNSIKSTPAGKVMDKIESMKDGSFGKVANAIGTAANSTPVKAVNDAISKAQGKADEFIDGVKDKVVDKVMESGIQNNPEVKNVVSSTKSKLSELGVDVDAYIDAYKSESTE